MLIGLGYTHEYGARPLKRVVARELESRPAARGSAGGARFRTTRDAVRVDADLDTAKLVLKVTARDSDGGDEGGGSGVQGVAEAEATRLEYSLVYTASGERTGRLCTAAGLPPNTTPLDRESRGAWHSCCPGARPRRARRRAMRRARRARAAGGAAFRGRGMRR